jgi:hypothetical protein
MTSDHVVTKKFLPCNKACSFFGILFFTLFISSITTSCQSVTVGIASVNLSHRVVLLDTVEKRLKLLISFTIGGELPSGPEGTKAKGILSRDGSPVASFSLPHLDYFGGNFAFYLPYTIAPGEYNLTVALTDIPSGDTLVLKNYKIDRIETVSHREPGTGHNWMLPAALPLRNPPDEELGALITPEEKKRGYILWHRNPFRYVYPNSAPQQPDVISSISVKLAQNEYEPLTFSLYALQDLAMVKAEVSPLTAEGGVMLPFPEIYVVKAVPRIKKRQSPKEGYELRPRLLEKKYTAAVRAGESRRFWLTFYAPPETPPGNYRGTVKLTTNFGSTAIPITVEVLPFVLVERSDKEYGFNQTYVFQEMTAQDLTDDERAKVYENGLKYYRSFKEHGLTTIFPHCSYVFRRLPDGTPDLRDLEAALKAFVEVGFTGPFIYYSGHLVQSAKPGWAGSTAGFDAERHPLLMKEIISFARANIPEMDLVDFYWMPGDEVHDDRGGPDRLHIAELLLNAVKEMGEKTAMSVKSQVSWPLNIKLDDQPLYGEPWYYPNRQTTMVPSVDDAPSMRRMFGLYHLKTDYVGIVPWTFQTAENAAGDPYTDIDTSSTRAEVMVAYPGTDGPIPTPEYEAVREGIDDGRYAYILETRIKNAQNLTDTRLQNLGLEAEKVYQEILNKVEDATLEDMDANRETMVEWILKLDTASDMNPHLP